jgi:hypothetical protein
VEELDRQQPQYQRIFKQFNDASSACAENTNLSQPPDVRTIRLQQSPISKPAPEAPWTVTTSKVRNGDPF